jgi:hypothetical protein
MSALFRAWGKLSRGGSVAIIRAVGLGLAAGAVGTIALTIAEKAEMAATGRKPSTVPGQVGAKLSAHDPESHPEVVERADPLMHWAHGIGLGGVRGLLDAAGMSRPAATLAFFPIVWAGDAALYRALGIAPLPWQWTPRELATDLFGKGVLAFATSGAYVLLDEAS